MRLSNGLREFLESLNSRGIDYVISWVRTAWPSTVGRVTREIWIFWFDTLQS